MTLLECKHLCKSFDKRVVLDDVSFKIGKGKIVGLLGKNGAGKSTIIKLINDLLTIDSGEILFKGQPIGVYSKSHISYLPERTYLDKSMTIASSFKLFSDFYHDFDIARARALLADLDLDETMKISKMSKGMQEKLQLILVISRDADLYILDEPLGGVDPATRDHILDTILSNFKAGSSVIISTHLISDVERILDDVIFVDKGKIVLTDSAGNLRKKHKSSIDNIFRSMFYAKKAD
ncbi:ABC transporter ATP-binding protein [Candidatus Saccharibacteria bacterium]|nr:ABC transporter ATP-binding protein [Candidatus Saccharibacteria bacterium]